MKELSLNNCRLDKRYDVLDYLGRGSYAEIFIARDILASPSSPHNTVVIKALNVFLQDDLDDDLERTLIENFQNEAVALDRVRHPNIISRLGHGTARDLKGTTFHYLVLEYLAGGDLQRLCRERSLDAKKALNYIEQVCAGLRHAHSKGVIHRDIKPHNLLLTKDLETVKIADFGVARIHSGDTPITRVGTNAYAPPEHSPLHSGETGELHTNTLTPAADIYSLAKCTYTLFTCESPRYYANKPIEALPAACRDAPWADELLEILRKSTQNDPAMRHQSVDEFWADMLAVQDIVSDGEPDTLVRTKASSLPQAHVSQGYSPLAPVKPKFDTSRDLRSRFPLIPEPVRASDTVITNVSPSPVIGDFATEVNGNGTVHETFIDHSEYKDEPIRRPRRFRKVAAFIIAIALFGGALYATGFYLRSTNAWSSIWGQMHAQTATANTDINLRSEPNATSDAIGLVTKNSKVRIVNSQNNWYQVDIIQQGRERSGGPTATRGWLNGRYIDIDDN
jgi:serine/threonine protein kinase